MPKDDEVIDVEEFHRDLQSKSYDDLKKKYDKAKEDNKALDTKNNKLRVAQDDLRYQLFERDQRHNRVARLLGFPDIESLEASVTLEDPWIPGGQVALSDAHARILLLKDELAKHCISSTEAQAVLAEANDELKKMHDELNEANKEAARMREQRDFAREAVARRAAEVKRQAAEAQRQADEAERYAAEAEKWRIEAQTKLPEMQALIREVQRNNLAQAAPRDGVEKENAPARRGEPTPSPLHDVANATSPTAVDTTPGRTPASDARHYKQQFDLLKDQYNALLALKEKLSARYLKDVMAWKRYKKWLVEDEGQVGKPGKRRVLRRKKVLDEMGPQGDLSGLDIDQPTVSADLTVDGSAKNQGPDITLLNPSGAVYQVNDDAVDTLQTLPSPGRSSPASPRRFPPTPPPRSPPAPQSYLSPTTPRNLPPSDESLTQPSSVPPASQHLQPATPEPNIGTPMAKKLDAPLTKDVDGTPSPSQKSLTQPSSAPSPTPVYKHMASLQTVKRVKKEPVDVIVIDSSPEKQQPAVKREPVEDLIMTSDEDRAPKQKATNPRIKSLKSRIGTISHTETPTTRSDLPPDRKRPRTAQPNSEPPPAHKSSFPPPPRTVKSDARAVRRSSTVLAVDTPPRPRAVTRHHSSPPDSPHVPRVDKGKRKAAEMENDEEDEDDGNESDPFIVGPSRSRAKPVTFQTREEKVAYLKALTKKPPKEYMAEYMPFKGRGRYSNAIAAADKTVNSEFEIDPARNGGVKYQFDAVVRDKNERKGLQAGDCECCRDYYAAVGPLPPRLQAPLWRSPSSSQSQNLSRPCRHKKHADHDDPPSSPSSEAQAKAIEAHKQEISRHRHNWAPTNTPPDYWHIGFPDTQAAESINRRAAEMHAQKYQKVATEASSKNGRYRKRK